MEDKNQPNLKVRLTDDFLVRALDTPVARAVPIIYGALGLLYIFLAPAHLQFIERTPQLAAAASLFSGICLLLIGSVLGWKPPAPTKANPLVALASFIAIANATVIQVLSGEPYQATNFMLVLIGSASILLRPAWLGLVYVAALGTWALAAGPTNDPQRVHYAFFLVSAAIIGIGIFSFRNITHRRLELYRQADRKIRSKLARALAASEGTMRQLAENAHDVLYRIGLAPRLHVQYVNPAVKTLTGHSTETFLVDEKVVDELIDEALLPAIRDAIADLKGPRNFELQLRRKDGTKVWTEHQVNPVFDTSGVLIAVDGICRDITERKRHEHELVEREKALERALVEAEEARDHAYETESMFRSLVEQSLVGIVIIQDGKFQYLNPRMEEMFGYALGDLFDKPIRTIVSDEDWPTVQENVRRRIDGETQNIHYGFKGVKQDGTPIDVYVQGVSSSYRGMPAVLGTTLDVTERNHALVKLRENERRVSTLMANLPGIAYRCRNDEDWTMEFVSEGSTQLTGYRPEEIVGSKRVSFAELIHPLDRDRVWQEVQKSVAAGEPFQLVYRSRTKDGAERWFWEQGTAIRSPGGDVEALEGFIADITDQKRYEAALHEAKEKAEEANRVKSSIFANMSHEIRTPMTAVLGYSDLLRRKVQGTELEKDTELIQKGGRRLLQLLNNVLDLARLEAGKADFRRVPHPLYQTIDRVVGLLGILADQKNLSLTVSVDDEILVATDEHAEEQVLTNVLGNAIKFTDTGGIEVRAETTSAVDGGKAMARVTVQDTGKGISQSFLPQVFDEFRQESEGLGRSFEGSGLGLAISKKLVLAMGGDIRIESTPGSGTRVTIDLPLALETSQPSPWLESDDTAQRPRESRKVLIVEDDEATGKLLEATLSDHKVAVTANADEALQEASTNHYDIVLVDINLKSSRLDGIGVLHELRKMKGYGRTPIFAVTAYAMQGDREKFLREGFTGYVPKPFEPDAVNRLVNSPLAH